MSYTYDAAGRKLRKVSGCMTTEYIDGIQYDNGVLSFIQTEEGRIIKSGSTYNYEYTLKDHLGNNRVTFDKFSGAIRKVGEENYYPFGLNKHIQVNAGSKYLYNSKELQEELDEYDYGARFYDPVIGRWNVVDALADEDVQIDKSPYAYAWNNPVNLTDADGNCPRCPGVGYSNPMYAVAEGFRQYFQAAGRQVDKAFVSVSETFSKVVSKVEGSIGIGSATVTTSVDVTNTTTARTNLGGFMEPHGKNTPSEPLIKITNTTDVSQNTKTEVKGTIRGVDVKATNTTGVSLTTGKGTITTEAMAGKGGNGVYVSNKVNPSGSQTDVGVKASYKATETKTSSTTFSLKAGVTVYDDKRK